MGKRERKMKVTLNTDGTVAFEVATAAEAIALARELQHGTAVEEVAVEADSPVESETVVLPEMTRRRGAIKRYEETLVKASESVGLTVPYYLVWDFLLQHETTRGGVSATQIARAFRISQAAASQRLCMLHKEGYAERVSTGRYRATMP